jgi:two-component system LytT family response regulator|tara:strand:+ start:2484 stop:3068 length:585 start_codon:yes stop_codon:yes gene_type:complete
MGDGTGFDVLDAITYSDYLIVFITAYQEYAISAFKFNAVDFILKPIDPKDLLVTFKRIEDCFKNNNFTTPSQIKSVKSSIGSKTTDYNFIAIPSTKKIDLVRIDDILYLESDGRYTTIHLVDKSTLFVSKNIVEYEKLLSTSYFFCIHKKYMINLKYIINISNSDGSNCELVGKLMLPVAKRRKEDLVSFLNIR